MTRVSRVIRCVLYVFQVKRGDYPVLGAKVEVTAMYPASNVSSVLYKEKFDLLDTGSGGEWVS